VEYYRAEVATKKPIVMGWQAAGAAPIVRGQPVDNPETVATAIRIGNPASWKGALAARDQSGGAIDTVTDDEILAAYRLLAQEEGIFGEPASAACVAGLLKVGPRLDLADKTVVCIITGHGLKDPDTALTVEAEMTDVPAELDAVERAMDLT
jgi:threonine synthase